MNTDTRNQLKKLVMEVINEVAASRKAKKISADEKTKTAKLPKNNTQMKAVSSKSITSTTDPKGKVEGKKLPVVKKPAAPKVTKEGLKASILGMIKEELEQEYRTKGALGAKNANREQPLKKYVPKGVPGMGRPSNAPVTSALVTVDNRPLGEFDLSAKLPSGKPDMTPLEKRIRTFIYNDPDMAAYAINPSVIAAFDKISDLELDGKLTDANRKINLRVQDGELVA